MDDRQQLLLISRMALMEGLRRIKERKGVAEVEGIEGGLDQ